MAHLKVAVCVMVRNEERSLAKTLESCRDIASCYYVYDTGSTDNTVQIAKDHGAKVLEAGKFVDFATSRNAMHDWVESDDLDITHLLLLDANDELRGAAELKSALEKLADNPEITANGGGFMLRQRWHYGNNGMSDTYYNIRLVTARQGWRYKGAVHEYICRPRNVSQATVKIALSGVEIFQDRTVNCETSQVRFVRDREILLREFQAQTSPADPRTVFYLAQTCHSLGRLEEAYYYYKLRMEFATGFHEEKFTAALKLGDISRDMGMDIYTSLMWWFQAVVLMLRAEPLVKIAAVLLFKKLPTFSKSIHPLVYALTSLACSLKFPDDCSLFVDRRAYDYMRWHLHGIVCYYVGKTDEGREACEKAIAAENQDIDKSNLQFYK